MLNVLSINVNIGKVDKKIYFTFVQYDIIRTILMRLSQNSHFDTASLNLWNSPYLTATLQKVQSPDTRADQSC